MRRGRRKVRSASKSKTLLKMCEQKTPEAELENYEIFSFLIVQTHLSFIVSNLKLSAWNT